MLRIRKINNNNNSNIETYLWRHHMALIFSHISAGFSI